MTSAQIYDALASILKVSNVEAQEIANHIMTLTLGRNTTESTSWITVPPAQRNDLQTTEKMPTKLLNSLSSGSTTVEAAVNGFSSRMTEVVGNHYPGQADDEAFSSIGNNLIQTVYNLKRLVDSGEIGEGSVIRTNITITNTDWIKSNSIAKYPYEKHIELEGVHSNDDVGNLTLDIPSIIIASESGLFGGGDVGDGEIIFYSATIPSGDISGHLTIMIKN